jgi:Flp pilus assembly CpaE family ATPase
MVAMSDPLHEEEPTRALSRLRQVATSVLDLFIERSADEHAPIPIESHSVRLAKGRRIGFVSLTAGCGTTTTASLVAQRSGGGGARVRLLDLDLVAPAIGLIAQQRGPTITDVLVDESVRPRRWGSVDVVFGGSTEIGPGATAALVQLIQRFAAESAVVIDAGALCAPASDQLLRACDTVVYVSTPRAAHVYAGLRAASHLRALAIDAQLVLTRSDPITAALVARELGMPVGGAIPEDPFLAKDEFRIRAETARAIDLLAAALAA